MEYANLVAGSVGILLGFLAGAMPGLHFWREDWLGGYGSWRRRAACSISTGGARAHCST